jgi:hypothetical protein
MEGQTGAAAEQGMDAIATQERTRMMGGSMTHRSIGIGFAPRQDRGAINDEIASPHQTAVQGVQDAEDEEGFMDRCPGTLTTFALLRRTGKAQLPLSVAWQATSHRQGRLLQRCVSIDESYDALNQVLAVLRPEEIGAVRTSRIEIQFFRLLCPREDL